ncbi:18S rRNA (guanine1575-N7)-methyltransferase [Nematocida sp. AWRm77]|nr:18S rRNA (guanine1575-N7)-methyltransferase [Nematocida sp. AWRm77]
MGKPEHSGQKVYYTGDIAETYDKSTSLNNIQGRITERCLEIIKNPEGALILDVGCGSGISTEKILDSGNYVVGIDISREMLGLAQKRVGAIVYDTEPAEKFCDFAQVDIGEGLPFQSATFDYAVSVSVLQWLCVQDDFKKLLGAFFYTLYDVLKSNGMAVLQYFPETDKHMEDIMKYAKKHGFSGGTLIENADSKKKRKTYLILEMAYSKGQSNHVPAAKEKKSPKHIKNKDLAYRDWILRKKEKRQALGLFVPATSKYTGRRRKGL